MSAKGRDAINAAFVEAAGRLGLTAKQQTAGRPPGGRLTRASRKTSRPVSFSRSANAFKTASRAVPIGTDLRSTRAGTTVDNSHHSEHVHLLVEDLSMCLDPFPGFVRDSPYMRA